MPEIVPLHYHILLEPDLSTFRFSGQTTVHLKPSVPAGEIVLNICDLAVWKTEWIRQSGTLACPFQVDPEKETLRVFLAECTGEEIDLRIVYEGVINDRMAGLYRSSYRTENGIRWIAVSQLQESDARRVFPCLDHPAQKATFDVELKIDKGLVAVSNGAIQSIDPLSDGRKSVCFETTPRMSTYLLFIGVGRFETIQDPEDPRVKAITVPGMSAFAEFGLEFGKNALRYCERYFGIPYPLSKLDLIAVPDFAFGAMENWGAITFRENLLLRYPESTSKSGLERICEVTAHEIVHQWFGNLVTPEDWRYLWLNESFATFFAYGVVDELHPGWKIWDRFIGGQTAEALERDGLKETFAIEIPGGEHVVINSSTAPIIYSKGGSVLRQILGFIGPDAFQKGLTRYLNSHAYGSTASRDLWEALEAECDQPITRMMKDWIGQPGHPLVEVHRRGNTLRLHQGRFSYLEGAPDATWLVPVNIRLFGAGEEETTLQVVMKDADLSVPIDDGVQAYKINEGQSGFYRVQYRDEENLVRLGLHIRDKRLSAADRWGLASDLEALLRAGRIDLDRYLRFLEYYKDEDRLLPAAQVIQSLHRLFIVAPASCKEQIQKTACPFLHRLLTDIGYAPAAEEPHSRTILREHCLWPAAVMGLQEAEDFGKKRFKEVEAGQRVDPDIFKSVLQLGAWTWGTRALSWFMARLSATGSEHERMTIAMAMGSFREKKAVDAALQAVLDIIPDRNKFIPVVAMASNPDAIAHLWPWYTENLPAIEHFHPMLYERVVAALIPTCGLILEKEVKSFFENYLKKHSLAADAIRMSLEKLEINLALRRRMEARKGHSA
ncbi:MAG: M1 family metallopeptidase [Desulfobacterales bacterium]|nr:M1 family metallopeptidase [Desulfobacterales bacterium]